MFPESGFSFKDPIYEQILMSGSLWYIVCVGFTDTPINKDEVWKPQCQNQRCRTA